MIWRRVSQEGRRGISPHLDILPRCHRCSRLSEQNRTTKIEQPTHVKCPPVATLQHRLHKITYAKGASSLLGNSWRVVMPGAASPNGAPHPGRGQGERFTPRARTNLTDHLGTVDARDRL